MSITINNAPGGNEGFCLSKNLIVIKASADDMVTTPGVNYKLITNIDTMPVVGDTMSFGGGYVVAKLGGSVVFTIVAGAGSGALEIGEYATMINKSEWIDEALLPALNSHPGLSSIFAFSRSAERLVIDALETGATPGVSVSDTGTLATSTHTETTGVGLVLNANVGMWLRANVSRVWAGGEYLRSPWLKYDATINSTGTLGVIEVDMSDVVDAMLDGLDVPGTFTFVKAVSTSARKLFIEVQVRENDTVLDSKRTATIGVLKGGTRLNDSDVSYDLLVGTNAVPPSRFLTARPQEVWVHKTLEDYLYFHARWKTDSAVNMVVEAQVYYANNTSVTDTLFTLTSTSYQRHQVLCIKAGFDQNDLDSFSPGADVVKYVIRVKMGSEVVEQTYYILDESDTAGSLLYYNSFGLLEGMSIEGARGVTGDHTRDVMAVGRALAKNVNTVLERSYNRKLQPVMDIVCAPMAYDEWLMAMDALLSKDVTIKIPYTEAEVVGQIVPGSVSANAADWEGNSVASMGLQVRLNKEHSWGNLTGKLG